MLSSLGVTSVHGALLACAVATGQATPPAGARVVLIGVDGVSLNLLEPYAEAGVTPNLAALMKQGARGHLASLWPLRTPQIWTSIVTGKLPGQHGIWDNQANSYFYPPPFREPTARVVTSKDRRAKALWSLLDAQGLKVLSVGWVASWPAEALTHGVMVAPIELPAGDKRQSTIKGSFWRDASELVAPQTLWPRVQKLIVEPDELTPAEVGRFADVPPSGHALYQLPRLERYVYALRWSLARTKSVEAITTALAAETRPDVVLAYFECTDSLLHRFWIFKESPAEIRERLDGHKIPSQDAAELKRRFGGVVEACYRDVDERLGRMLKALSGPETRVLVVSDHGFGRPQKPHHLADEPYSGDHLDEGVILAAGPGIEGGAWLEGASVLDVTPTLLHWLGLPVAQDMRGKVIAAIAPGSPRRVPTYESAPQTEAPFAQGWPERKVPPRPTAAQMPAAKP